MLNLVDFFTIDLMSKDFGSVDLVFSLISLYSDRSLPVLFRLWAMNCILVLQIPILVA